MKISIVIGIDCSQSLEKGKEKMKRKKKTEDFLVLVGVFVPILAVEKK